MAASLIVFFLVILLLLILHPSEGVKNIIILGGDTNMSGRGRMNETLPDCNNSKPGLIIRFNANNSWEVAHDPLHAGIDIIGNVGIGPGMPFSNALLNTVPQFGVIGARTRAALDGGGVIRALLWYQGDSDTNTNNNDASLYKTRFQQFISYLRADLQSPVALNFNVSTPNTEMVRTAQLETADEIPYVNCIDARGLRLNDDDAHLTTTAQVHLGSQMAEVFLQF